MNPIIAICIALAAQIIVALGAIILLGRADSFKKRAPYLLCFSAGTFLGLAFFDLLPEAFELMDAEIASYWVLGGFLFFFGLSKLVHWYHHHGDDHCDEPHGEATGTLVTIGDFLHNFFDGIVIAAAFLVDIRIGIATAIAVTAHEIPQEVSDFAVLLHSGWSRGKALLANGIAATGSILGAAVAIIFSSPEESSIAPLIAIAAGNFLYIAASDLLPRFDSHGPAAGRIKKVLAFLVGLAVMFALSLIGGHEH
jgi:zinc and cadmium transporter